MPVEYSHLFHLQNIIVTGPGLQNQLCEHEKLPIFFILLYHNLHTISTSKIKSLSLLQNLMGFLLKFAEMGYLIHS